MSATATRAAPQDTDSFESFYRGQVDTIYRALELTLADHEVAREATDEAMLRAYARWFHRRRLREPERMGVPGRAELGNLAMAANQPGATTVH